MKKTNWFPHHSSIRAMGQSFVWFMIISLMFHLFFASMIIIGKTSLGEIGVIPIPPEARLEDVSHPDHIIGTGTPESCTSHAFLEAVSKGGTIVFNGGDKPFTITLTEQAKVYNDAMEDVVIDGGGLVTLSGGGVTRILYMNTCDPNLVWTTSHCQNQDHPRLTVQNLHFANGNSSKDKEYSGGGAIWVRGGQFKVINCTFTNNVCESTGPDVGGGAIRVFSQYENRPVYIVNSIFGGKEGLGNVGSNGGAISSIGVSWTIINSEFSYNKAIGNGGNPSQPGTPGGGSGGAIYNDGNEMTLTLMGTIIENNTVNAYGSGIFFVTNNHTGDINLVDSIVSNNIGGSWYPLYPNISMHSDTKVTITQSLEHGITQGLATPTSSVIIVNNKPINFEAYLINNNNYFKLRDLAQILSGTGKSFEVFWNSETGNIELTGGKNYTSVGGEFVINSFTAEQKYKRVIPKMYVDGMEIQLNAYLINNNNYFKLRDIGTLFDFGVSWDEETNQVRIDTSKNYGH